MSVLGNLMFWRRPRVNVTLSLDALLRARHIQENEWREQILRDGGATLLATTNIAPGTIGYQVHRLERDGMLIGHCLPGILRDEDAWHYTLTAKGRRMALAMAD